MHPYVSDNVSCSMPFRLLLVAIRVSTSSFSLSVCCMNNAAEQIINDTSSVSCVKPSGALYMFLRVDAKRFSIHEDQKLVLDCYCKKNTTSTGQCLQLAVSKSPAHRNPAARE
ncbi:MAG: hypothetical protein HNEKOMLI_00059 [Sodalis sp. Psp]|nr:hypothetical protein [Sodalis sp. Psp]MCR3756566.1 hypothetical protein [Sodalis sp. Ppy]